MAIQEDKTILQIKLDREIHHRFKVICTEKRTTMQDEIAEFVRSQVYHAQDEKRK